MLVPFALWLVSVSKLHLKIQGKGWGIRDADLPCLWRDLHPAEHLDCHAHHRTA